MAEIDFSAPGYARAEATHPWWMRADDPRRLWRDEHSIQNGDKVVRVHRHEFAEHIAAVTGDDRRVAGRHELLRAGWHESLHEKLHSIGLEVGDHIKGKPLTWTFRDVDGRVTDRHDVTNVRVKSEAPAAKSPRPKRLRYAHHHG